MIVFQPKSQQQWPHRPHDVSQLCLFRLKRTTMDYPLFYALWISPLIPLNNEFRASEILKVATIALSYLSYFINIHIWVWYCSVVHDDYISDSASQREMCWRTWCCPICLFLEGHPPYISMCFALKPSFWSGISQRPALFDDTGGLLVHSWFHYLIEIFSYI